MILKPDVRGPGTVFNGTLVERLRARVAAYVAARFAEQHRVARDRAAEHPIDRQRNETR
jgi:hypothetical protein